MEYLLSLNKTLKCLVSCVIETNIWCEVGFEIVTDFWTLLPTATFPKSRLVGETDTVSTGCLPETLCASFSHDETNRPDTPEHDDEDYYQYTDSIGELLKSPRCFSI